MIEFNKLSNGQLRYVNMVSMFHPEIKDEITFEQINSIHEEFLKLRPKYKIGYPNWLLVHNRLDRGLYFFPRENVDKPVNNVIIDTEEEQFYQSLLHKFKIK